MEEEPNDNKRKQSDPTSCVKCGENSSDGAILVDPGCVEDHCFRCSLEIKAESEPSTTEEPEAVVGDNEDEGEEPAAESLPLPPGSRAKPKAARKVESKSSVSERRTNRTLPADAPGPSVLSEQLTSDAVGKRVSVFWLEGKKGKWYAGTIQAADATIECVSVKYDDGGDLDEINLSEEHVVWLRSNGHAATTAPLDAAGDKPLPPGAPGPQVTVADLNGRVTGRRVAVFWLDEDGGETGTWYEGKAKKGNADCAALRVEYASDKSVEDVPILEEAVVWLDVPRGRGGPMSPQPKSAGRSKSATRKPFEPPSDPSQNMTGLFQCTVPEGMGAGDQLTVDVPGQGQYHLTVPPNHQAGATFNFKV